MTDLREKEPRNLRDAFSARGMRCKLKNRRVIVHPSLDGKEWYVKFKLLVDRKAREVRTTDIILSDEALSALCNLYLTMQKIC